MNTIDYNQQVADFLDRTGTSISFKFKEHGRYFPDDKDTRDIWIIVLRNDRNRYRFTFGQSIAKSDGHTPPRAYDVLSCLTKYNPGTFDNFCGDYGYDNDSRKAYKAYKAVLREWKNIELLFTDEEIEQLREIQ